MKKILFNDTYKLTEKVIREEKKQTRRSIPERLIIAADNYAKQYDAGMQFMAFLKYLHDNAPYREGEVVAVAMSYSKIFWDISINDYFQMTGYPDIDLNEIRSSAAWNNKMFAKAELMPYRIKIKRVFTPYLKDLSESDAIEEGVDILHRANRPPLFHFRGDKCRRIFKSAKEAYKHLITDLYSEYYWRSNPLVYGYEFELVKN